MKQFGYAVILEGGKVLLWRTSNKGKSEFAFPGGEISQDETPEVGLARILDEKGCPGRIRKKLYIVTGKNTVSHFFLFSRKTSAEGEWIPMIELRKKGLKDEIIVRNLLQDFEIHGDSLRSVIKELTEE